jgi:hypothetical protein
MDESLYIAAALRILGGDLILNSFWFDKFFITPVTLAMGILIGGENQIGFRLSALGCSAYATYIITNWILKNTSTWMIRISMILLALGVWFSPFMLFYHVSSFTDSFLLLFLLLFTFQLHRAALSEENRSTYERRSYHFFAVAALFKLSALMWSPVFAGYWFLTGGFKKVKRGIIDFLKTSKWWIAAGLAYSLANPEKLAPVLWFKGLGKGAIPPLGDRAIVWVEKALRIFPAFWTSAIFFTLIISLLAFLFWIYRRKSEKEFRIVIFMFAMPVTAHVIGLWLSGAATFDRYLYIVLPQMILFFVAGSNLISSLFKKPWLLPCYSFIIGFLGIGLLSFSGISYQYLANQLPTQSFGRTVFFVRDALPNHATVHNKSLLWYLYPFDRNGTISKACDRRDCMERERLGREPYGNQYWLSTNDDLSSVALKLKIPACDSNLCTQIVREFRTDIFVSESQIRESLRLKNWAERVEVNLVTQGRLMSDEDWVDIPGPEAKILVTTKNLPILGSQTLQINGKIILLNNDFAAKRFGSGRWTAALEIREMKISGNPHNFVDVTPILYGSYIIPLAPLDLPSDQSMHEMITNLDMLGDVLNVQVIKRSNQNAL